MNQNTYIKNIERFALPSVSMTKFRNMLKQSTAGNPMFVKWRTSIPPTHRASYEMYWGKFYSNSDQSVTKEEEDMVNLVAPTTIEGWRTLTYDNISSFKFEGKTYTIN
jgi:hypothetical protein